MPHLFDCGVCCFTISLSLSLHPMLTHPPTGSVYVLTYLHVACAYRFGTPTCTPPTCRLCILWPLLVAPSYILSGVLRASSARLYPDPPHTQIPISAAIWSAGGVRCDRLKLSSDKARAAANSSDRYVGGRHAVFWWSLRSMLAAVT